MPRFDLVTSILQEFFKFYRHLCMCVLWLYSSVLFSDFAHVVDFTVLPTCNN